MGSSLILGDLRVRQTPPGGCSAEEWAEILLAEILTISSATEGPARDQALAFRDALRAVLVRYFREALDQQRVGLVLRLRALGFGHAAAVAEGER